jgi:hypothetical protein
MEHKECFVPRRVRRFPDSSRCPPLRRQPEPHRNPDAAGSSGEILTAIPTFAVGSTSVASATPPEISRRAVVVAVARRGGPHLLEATFVPAALFYCCLVWGGLTLAYLTVLGWMYGAVTRRLIRRRTVPTILVLGVVGITVRTAMALASGSTFIYFVQPILGTLATAGVFLFSLLGGRPLIGRLAIDFWPITPEMADNPRVISLFKGLTVLWAGINLVTAGATLTLLLTLPLATFVAAKQASGLAISTAGIVVTVRWSHRIACHEGVLMSPRRRRAPVAILLVSPGRS